MITKRTCIVCGKTYKYCKGCNSETPAWASIFDSQNCHDIFEALASKVSDGEKKQMLSGLDLSGIEGFNEDVKNQIKALDGAAVPSFESKEEAVIPENGEAVSPENFDF